MRKEERLTYDTLLLGRGTRIDEGLPLSHHAVCLIEIFAVLADIKELLLDKLVGVPVRDPQESEVDSPLEHKSPSAEEHQTKG